MEATIGGTRRHIVDVARGQLQAGLEVDLAVAATRDPDFHVDLEQLQREGATVHLLPMVREIRPLSDGRQLLELRRILRARRPDVVHSHSSKGGVLGRVASLSTGIGVRVHTPHTFAFLFEALFSPAKRRFFRLVESRLARHTACIVAVGEGEAQTFRSSGVVDEGRIRVVPNGIDPDAFLDARPLARESLSTSPSAPLVAVVGLVYPGKGQDLALDALRAPGCEDVHAFFAGPGELDWLRAGIAERGLDGRVRVLDSRTDVPCLLAAADVLLLPSRWEGMPYVVLEAMASARGVVANPVDGARELVLDGETGFLASEIDGGALGEALASWVRLDTDARAALGDRGRERMLGGYTTRAMVLGLIDVYEEVLGPDPAPRSA